MEPYLIDIPSSFDSQSFFHAAWRVVGSQQRPTETLQLRFVPQAAYRILEGGYAHLSQVRERPDHSVEATLQAPLDSSGVPREVMAWVLSWGPRVEVIGPAHLREYWLSELRAALAGALATDAASPLA